MPEDTFCDRCDNVVDHLEADDGVRLCEFCTAIELGREFEAQNIALRTLAGAVRAAGAAGLTSATIRRATVLAAEHEDTETAIEACAALAGWPDLQGRLLALRRA